jgi:hypothetical protein
MSSQQLQLWEPLDLNIECGQIIPSKTMAVEELNDERLKRLPKGKFKIHSDGGWHCFKDVPDAEDIFKQQVWPWIEVKNEKKDKIYILQPVIMHSKSFYSQISLNIDGRSNNVKILMHQLVALAFIHNPDPSKKKLVDHINSFKPDYRVENLRWLSHSENSIGTPITSRTPINVVYKMWKDSLKNEE